LLTVQMENELVSINLRLFIEIFADDEEMRNVMTIKAEPIRAIDDWREPERCNGSGSLKDDDLGEVFGESALNW